MTATTSYLPDSIVRDRSESKQRSLTAYEVPLFRCSIVREGSLPVEIGTDSNNMILPEHLANLLGPIFHDADREMLVVAALAPNGYMTGVQIVAIGGRDAVMGNPREVFKAAMLMDANKLVIAHNHPQGTALPSNNDRMNFQILEQIGEKLGIELVDALVIAPGPTPDRPDFFSIASNESRKAQGLFRPFENYDGDKSK